MTPRERLFAVLNGDAVDRVPVWLLFPYHPIGCYVDVRTHPEYRPLHELSLERAITLDRRNFGVQHFTDDVHIGEEHKENSDLRIKRRWLEYKGRRLCAETRSGSHSSAVKKFLQTDEDLEFFCSLPILKDKATITAKLDEWLLPRYLADRSQFPICLGSMMLSMNEPIGFLYGCANLESLAIWSLTHNDMIVDLLDRMQQQHRIVYEYCLERDLGDVYFMVGSELASPPMVSRSTFQQWIVPYAQELIALVHRYGKKVIQHYHGQIKEILPDFLTMAPDALHTIEAPPVGNCTLTEAFEVVGDEIVLIGNIQYDEFRACTPEQMAQQVHAVLNECRGKRFILSPTAGPFDPEVSDRVIENYTTFMNTAWNSQEVYA